MIDDLNMYNSFLAVAGAGSVSAAARALFVSQPALSAEIARLEAALGVQLFFRTARGVTLTFEGELCRDYVTRAMSALEAGEDSLRDVAGLRSGLLRIGASDMTLRFYLLGRLQSFRDAYPDVRISVTNAPTPQTLEALRRGEIDFGAITDAGDLAAENPDLVMTPVREVRDVFVCSPAFADAIARGRAADPAHAQSVDDAGAHKDGVETDADPAQNTDSVGARKDRAEIGITPAQGVTAARDGGASPLPPVTAAELAALPLIMLESDTSTTRYVRSRLERAAPDCDFTPAIELATSDLVLEFARRGMGVAAIVRDFAEDALAAGEVVELALTEPLPPRHMMTAHLRTPPLCAAAKRFLGEAT